MEKVTQKMAIGLTVLTVLSSCGQSDSSKKAEETKVSVDSNGACTSQFVTDYNAALRELKALTNYYSAAQVQTAINACDRFFGTHKVSKCKADIDYVFQEVDTKDLKTACDEVRKMK